MRSFIACHIPDRRSRVQIGFDQISPSACSTRDPGARLGTCASVKLRCQEPIIWASDSADNWNPGWPGEENRRYALFSGKLPKANGTPFTKICKKAEYNLARYTQISKKLSWNFPFHLTFLSEFQKFSIEWFPFWKFTQFSEFLETFPGKFCTFCRCFQIFKSFG